MTHWLRVLSLAVCMATVVAGIGPLTKNASSAGQGADPVSVKIGPSLAILLDMEKYNFPAPSDSRVGQTIAAMRKAGKIDVMLQPDHELSAGEMNAVQSMGVAFPGRGTAAPASSSSVQASIPLGKVRDVASLSFVRQVDLWWTPWTQWTLDEGVPEMNGDLVWPLKDSQNQALTGQGTKVAIFDSGIDLRHPDFWKADGQTYSWKDANPYDGAFVPGTDYLDLNSNNQKDYGETLRYFEAPGSENNTPGVFDTDTEWLYLDSNENQVRDTNLTEGVPTYGEQIFVVNDANKNRRLDPGETITALHTSKVEKTYLKPTESSDPVEYTRGDNLVQTLSVWPGTYEHGTKTAGIVAGGTIGRKYVGVAPGAELLVASPSYFQFPSSPNYISWAENNGAEVMLYEFGSWIGQYMDGSSGLEQAIQGSAQRGYVQVTAAGNLADGQKHFRNTVAANNGYQDVIFNVPQPNPDIKGVDLSVLWRVPSVDLQFEIATPSGNSGPLPGDGSTVNAHGYAFSSKRSPGFGQGSSAGTAMFTISITRPTDQLLENSVPWHLYITNPSGQSIEVNGYEGDKYYWAGGVTFANYDASRTVAWPATANNAITVAAYMASSNSPNPGDIRPYSGRGPRIDGSADLDIAAPSDYTLTTDTSYRTGGNPLGYHYHAGTSAAAPFVAGTVALMLQKDSSLTPSTVETRIHDNARKDTFTGLNPDVNVWGYGKLDALRAVSPGTPILGGTVTLQGSSRHASGRVVPLTVKLYTPGMYPNGLVTTYSLATTDEGSSVVAFRAASQVGTYDVTAKSLHTLLSIRRNVPISSPSVSLDMGTLLEGDCNDSGVVNIQDFSILAATYMKLSGQPGYDARADFDYSGQITILDFSLLAANYMKYSPIEVGSGAGMATEGPLTLSTADLTLQPSTQTVQVGQTFNVIIQVAAGDQQVSGVDAFVNFDPAYLEVVSITNSTALPNQMLNRYDNGLGTLDFSAGTTSTAPSGTFTMGTVQFRAKAQTAGTALTFSQTAGRNTLAAYGGDLVLGNLTGATIVIQP